MTQPAGGDGAPRISGQFCAMLAVDIAEYTRPDRDHETQLHLRTWLYALLREALSSSGCRSTMPSTRIGETGRW